MKECHFLNKKAFIPKIILEEHYLICSWCKKWFSQGKDF